MNRNSDLHQHSLRPDLLGTRRSAHGQRILGRLERNAGQRSRQRAVVSAGVFAAALLVGALAWLAWSNGAAPAGAGPATSGHATGAPVGSTDAALTQGGLAGPGGGARLLREPPAAGSSQFETALSIAQVAAGVKASTHAAPADAARAAAPAPQGSASGAPLRAPGAERVAGGPAAQPGAAPAGQTLRQGAALEHARAAARRRGHAMQAVRQRSAPPGPASEAPTPAITDPDVALISAIRQASRPVGN